MKKIYNHPHENNVLRLNRLISMGLIVEDNTSALKILKNLGYQRIRDYSKFFEKEHKIYQDNVKFEQIISVINFDKHLKSLIFEIISDIELSFKENWADHLAEHHGSLAYQNEMLYRDKSQLKRDLSSIFKEMIESKNEHIQAKLKKYYLEFMPIHVVKDIMSFGQISRHFQNLKDLPLASKIAHTYSLEDEVLKSWLRHLVEVRNIIAHHNILWNTKLATLAKIPRKSKDVYAHPSSRGLYNTLVILNHFAHNLDNKQFKSSLLSLLNDNNHLLPAMGFPVDWQKKSIWDLGCDE